MALPSAPPTTQPSAPPKSTGRASCARRKYKTEPTASANASAAKAKCAPGMPPAKPNAAPRFSE